MRKFILFNKPGDKCPNIIMSMVQFHWQLLPAGVLMNSPDVKGGGLWYADHNNPAIYFWSVSSDFGKFNPEQLTQAIKEHGISIRWMEFKVFYSSETTENWNDVQQWTELKI